LNEETLSLCFGAFYSYNYCHYHSNTRVLDTILESKYSSSKKIYSHFAQPYSS